MLYDNISVNESGHLTFAGRDTVELAAKIRHSLYLMDEDKIRARVREYKTRNAKIFPCRFRAGICKQGVLLQADIPHNG